MATGVGATLEDNPAREPLQFSKLTTQPPIVGDGVLHLTELFCRQGNGDRLLFDLAGPLVARASPAPPRPILDGALADETGLAQGAA